MVAFLIIFLCNERLFVRYGVVTTVTGRQLIHSMAFQTSISPGAGSVPGFGDLFCAAYSERKTLHSCCFGRFNFLHWVTFCQYRIYMHMTFCIDRRGGIQ